MTMPVSNQFTKEAVKARLINNAANLWNVKNPMALDPFVRILIEAFSIEISKAANEAQIIEGRILDKIARLMTPTLLAMPHAAHAIMHAIPLEPNYTISQMAHFYAEKRIANTANGMMTETVEVDFTPVDSVPLVKAAVIYFAAGQQVFTKDAFGNKFSLLRSPNQLPWSTCFIGVEINNAVKDLDGVSVYFDFPSYNTQPWIYQLLPLCEVLCDGKKIDITGGRNYIQKEEISQQEKIFSGYELMDKMTQEVKNHYDHKFITLGSCPINNNDDSDINEMPEALLACFDNELLKTKLVKKVKWLQIKFPPNYTYEIMENMHVSINAFPVMNRTLLSANYGYKTINNILPLRTTGQQRFMTVHRLNDSHDRVFSEIPFNKSAQSSKGYYSLRHGGAERFDERTAQDLINYLLELTRDEVAAFSSLNQDHILTIMNDLALQIQRLQTKADKAEANIRQVPTYIVVEPYDENDSMEAAYWVSLAAQANGIRTSAKFSIKNLADIDGESICLLTDSIGGRDQLQAGERLDAYKHVFISRDRLISNEDIRNFCKYELGSRLEAVKFKQGLMPGNHPKQGYIRTLDIVLVPQKQLHADPTEWNYLAQSLYTKIKSRTPDGINYRVLVE
ncbi:MAG: hypothetical protein QM726_23045 [Chitinophagaceae bacterium]